MLRGKYLGRAGSAVLRPVEAMSTSLDLSFAPIKNRRAYLVGGLEHVIVFIIFPYIGKKNPI